MCWSNPFRACRTASASTRASRAAPPGPPHTAHALQLVDERGTFRSDNFAKLEVALQAAEAAEAPGKDGRKARQLRGSKEDGDQRNGALGASCSCLRLCGVDDTCGAASWLRLALSCHAGTRDGAKDGSAEAGGKKGGGEGGGGKKGGEGGGGDVGGDVLKLAKLAQTKGFDPVIFFSFSRRECEEYARKLLDANVDFTTAEEKEAVDEVFESAMQVCVCARVCGGGGE